MDVKTGSAPSCRRSKASRELAESIATVADGAGLPTVALITDMNEPLASAAGNAVEVHQRRRFPHRRAARRAAARGDAGARRRAAGAAPASPRDVADARAALAARARQRRGGGALRAHGRRARRPGRSCSPTRAALLPAAPRRRRGSARARRLSSLAIDARAVGLAVVELGGGRARASDAIDPAVGLTRARRPRRGGLGRRAARARPCARRGERRARPSARLARAYRIGDAPPPDRRSGDRRGSAARPREPAVRRAPAGTPRLGSPRSRALLPGRAIVTPETLADRAGVRYALAWRIRPGALERSAETRGDLLARRRRRSSLRRPAPARRPIVRVVDPDLTSA